jgi:hypothetical protein
MLRRQSNGQCSALCRAAALTLFVGIAGSAAWAQPQTSEQARETEALLRWAEVSHLTAEWQFPRELRRSTHPAGAGQALTLDVRFKHLPSDHDDDQENQRFEQFLALYQADHGLSFPDKVFYKFVEICDLRRGDAVVHLNVGTNDFAVFVDPASGELVSRLRATRFNREGTVLKVPQILSQARSLVSAVPKPTAAQDWPKRIREFLEDYFQKANRSAGLPEAKIVPDCDGNHVGLTVLGLRNQVFANGKYWEKIQVETDMWSVPEGIQLSANIDGFYASGIRGSGLPSDYPGYSDHDFPNELKYFSKTLFDKLKQALLNGAP